MNNNEAIQILSAYLDFKGWVLYPDEKFYEALEAAVVALNNAVHVNIEITEHHTFAKPDDVNKLDFPSVSSEDK